MKAPGIPGGIYETCGHTKQISLAIAVGMNAKRARKVVNTVAAYHKRLPVTLFVYGDYAELFPDDIRQWKSQFQIGMREDGPYPGDHFEKVLGNYVQESLVSTELRLQELNVQPEYYLPNSITKTIIIQAQKRGLRLVNATYEFPPKTGKVFILLFFF